MRFSFSVKCEELKKFIQFHIERYASDVMAWNFENFQITQSWVTIKEPGEEHGAHYHPNSVLSAVFFFQDNADGTESLKFLRPAGLSDPAFLDSRSLPELHSEPRGGLRNRPSGRSWSSGSS